MYIRHHAKKLIDIYNNKIFIYLSVKMKDGKQTFTVTVEPNIQTPVVDEWIKGEKKLHEFFLHHILYVGGDGN